LDLKKQKNETHKEVKMHDLFIAVLHRKDLSKVKKIISKTLNIKVIVSTNLGWRSVFSGGQLRGARHQKCNTYHSRNYYPGKWH